MLWWLVHCTVPVQTPRQRPKTWCWKAVTQLWPFVQHSYTTLNSSTTASMWDGPLRNGLYNLYITRYFPSFCSTQTNNFPSDYFSLLTETRQETMKCFSLKYFYIEISSVFCGRRVPPPPRATIAQSQTGSVQ